MLFFLCMHYLMAIAVLRRGSRTSQQCLWHKDYARWGFYLQI
uniref:Uncharacterized protein n=1 Tax=Arundo donax TaxID=35708 RepID=A0A0A9BIZ6_ARUDO